MRRARCTSSASRAGSGGTRPDRAVMLRVPLTARPTSTIPLRRAISTASVEGTEGVATYASPARAALNASSAEMRPVTRSPRPANRASGEECCSE